MFDLAKLSNLVLQLVSRESLVIKHLSQLAAIEPEVGVAEMGEPHNSEKQKQVRVV
jgi:hypothetical protein